MKIKNDRELEIYREAFKKGFIAGERAAIDKLQQKIHSKMENLQLYGTSKIEPKGFFDQNDGVKND